MKKTILAIAVSALFASGSVLACQGGSCGASSRTETSSGSYAATYGTGFASMQSGAKAFNITGADAYRYGGRGSSIADVGVGTSGFSAGLTTTYSKGLVYGNATGSTGAFALQTGTVDLYRSKYKGYHDHHNGAYGDYVDGDVYANSRTFVTQGSVAQTEAHGTGFAVELSGAKAWNDSGARAHSDVDRYHPDVLVARTKAWSNGGTAAFSGGLALGHASGESDASAYQRGYANAEADAEQGALGYYGHYRYQDVAADSHAWTESGASAGGWASHGGAHLSVQGTKAGSWAADGAKLVVCGECTVVHSSYSKSGALAHGRVSFDGSIGIAGSYGRTGGATAGYGDAETNAPRHDRPGYSYY